MTEHESARRRFLLQAGAAAATLPLLCALPARQAQAALAPLPVDNAQAKALGYVEDAASTRHAMFKPGSNCENCQFFTAATGACAIFPNFAVAPKGWCTAWAVKK